MVFLIDKEQIEDSKTDVIINWITIDLSGIDASYFKLHNKAGSQLYGTSIPFKGFLKDSDCFSTPGFLLYQNLVIHSVLPFEKELYGLMWRNIFETLKEYKKENILRTVSLKVPEINELQLFYNTFKEHCIIEDLKFYFYLEESQKELLKDYKFVKKILVNVSKWFKWEKLEKIFKRVRDRKVSFYKSSNKRSSS